MFGLDWVRILEYIVLKMFGNPKFELHFENLEINLFTY